MFNQLKNFIFKLAAIELSPQERTSHEESERIRREVEREQSLEQTKKEFERQLTPEDIKKAQEAAKEREETRPYGQ